MMEPHADLRARLLAYCREFEGAPLRAFEWRGRNCCHFAAGWWQRCTGCDALAGIAMPRSARAALRYLRDQRATLAQLVTQRIARAPIAAHDCAAGDLALVPTAGSGIGAALGICMAVPGCERALGVAVMGVDGRIGMVAPAAIACVWALPQGAR